MVVINPADGLITGTVEVVVVPFVNIVALGGPKFARFRALKNSALNWSLILSEMLVFLKSGQIQIG